MNELAKYFPPNLPEELKFLWSDLPLAFAENPEDYCAYRNAVAAEIKPVTFSEWTDVMQIADLHWAIRREQNVKAGIIKAEQKRVVAILVTKTLDALPAYKWDAERVLYGREMSDAWVAERKYTKKLTKELEKKGYSPQWIFNAAYVRAATLIEASDKRIHALEKRLYDARREIERRNEKFAQSLDRSAHQIIDVKFSRAA